MFAGGNRCFVQARMHASRIRTTPLLTLSEHALMGGVHMGVYIPRRVYIRGEGGNWLGGPTRGGLDRGGLLFKSGSCTCLMVKLPTRVGLRGGVPGKEGKWPGGCTWSGTPSWNIMTYRCKNFTLHQKSFVRSNNVHCDVFHEDFSLISAIEASIFFPVHTICLKQ